MSLKKILISFFIEPSNAWIVLIGLLVIFDFICVLCGVKRLKRGKPGCLIVFLVVVSWLLYSNYSSLKSPPAHIDSLAEIIDSSNMNHYHLWMFTRNRQQYFELVGPWSPLIGVKTFLTFGSGPPAYVFNQYGHLIDWTRDIYEDPRYSDRWYASDKWQNRQEISFKQALEFIEEYSELMTIESIGQEQ